MNKAKIEEKDGWYTTYVYRTDKYVPVIVTKDRHQAQLLYEVYNK